ncbi:TldD/PmbA family protein [Candidatus Woesearchaeota archaeon]|nr:TldD/PmbA family protein [Candidatus Woesearchaeota archaeon]MBU3942059.1 TldD/PmbA family protein [Nanoarchaeota archaeon]
MTDDKILAVMENTINRWMDVKQKLYIINKEIIAKPHFISLSYKEADVKTIDILNGAIVNNNGNFNDSKTGYSINVMIGDKKQGYGSRWEAYDHLPRDLEVLENLIDDKMDHVLKSALVSYISNIKDIIRVKQERGNKFSQLSNDPVAVYIEEKLNQKPIPENLILTLKNWTKKISKLDYVDESHSILYSEHDSRRFVDSQGRKILDHSFLGKVILTIDIRHNKNFEIPFGQSIYSAKGWDDINQKLEDILSEIPKDIEQLRNASIPTSDQYPVVFSAVSVGTIFHETSGGHNLSGRYIKKGFSTTFKNQLNKKIFPEFITVVDDPQKKGAFGFYRFDEEGIEGKRVVLVENGVLRNYILDRDSAVYFGKLSNGHSRGEWLCDEHASLPEPRVGNLEIISSNSVPDEELVEILKKYCIENNIECGLYIDTDEGEVDVDTSEFHLYPHKAWKIFPDGRRERITNFYVATYPYNLLKQIVVTGNSYKTRRGICDAESGLIPTQEIAPAAFIPRVTIQAEEPKIETKRLLEKLKD